MTYALRIHAQYIVRLEESTWLALFSCRSRDVSCWMRRSVHIVEETDGGVIIYGPSYI